MAGAKKPTARKAFDDNLADAEALVAVVQALENRRVRRMRRELRERLGEALGLPRKDWDDLDCVESEDLFAILKPRGRLDRDSLSEPNMRPLLRQALVAACAARGLREVVDLEIRRLASPAPSQIGLVLSIVGEKNLWKRVDKRRGVSSGASAASLDRIYERRNKIAHQGDRLGHGRATISIAEVVADLECIASIVGALDAETAR